MEGARSGEGCVVVHGSMVFFWIFGGVVVGREVSVVGVANVPVWEWSGTADKEADVGCFFVVWGCRCGWWVGGSGEAKRSPFWSTSSASSTSFFFFLFVLSLLSLRLFIERREREGEASNRGTTTFPFFIRFGSFRRLFFSPRCLSSSSCT